MHPGGKVPVMLDETKKDSENKSLVLFESHAIMKYICQSRKLPDTWYPSSNERDIVL